MMYHNSRVKIIVKQTVEELEAAANAFMAGHDVIDVRLDVKDPCGADPYATVMIIYTIGLKDETVF